MTRRPSSSGSPVVALLRCMHTVLVISFAAPAFYRVEDENLMIQFGSVIFPDCIRRLPGEDGLRIWVEGEPHRPAAAAVEAATKFQTVLGVLRTWRWWAGELVEEMRLDQREGLVRDAMGNQWVIMVKHMFDYEIVEGEIEQLAAQSAQGISANCHLRNALWLNGRRARTGADFYMIHEYARHEFGGTSGIAERLGISRRSQDRFTQLANNVSPLLGGRHATKGGITPTPPGVPRGFIADLLQRWITQHPSDRVESI
jgi:hypothetical protein